MAVAAMRERADRDRHATISEGSAWSVGIAHSFVAAASIASASARAGSFAASAPSAAGSSARAAVHNACQSCTRGRPVRRHRRRAGAFERFGLAQLLMKVAPFGHDDPRLGRACDHLDRGIAAARNDAVGRRDPVRRIVDPAQVPQIARRGGVPILLDPAERDPFGFRFGAPAQGERRARQARAAPAADDRDDVELVGQTQPRASVGARRHGGVDADAGGVERLGAHPVGPVRLFEHLGIGRDQQRGAFIRGQMPRIVAVAMLHHGGMRHRSDPSELAQFGRDIGDEQRGALLGEPCRQHRHRLGDGRPAQRRAMQRFGRAVRREGGWHRIGRRFEQRGDEHEFDPLVERREDVAARAEQRDRAEVDQRVRRRRRPLGMAAPLVVDEPADRLARDCRHGAHAASRRAEAAPAPIRASCALTPSTTPDA